uniref:Uncharacterized protein n=1 Tax=Oryza brachyantha TaxID=4533 RepID=J3NEM0_ORYBR
MKNISVGTNPPTVWKHQTWLTSLDDINMRIQILLRQQTNQTEKQYLVIQRL